jgi:hypothetical protein
MLSQADLRMHNGAVPGMIRDYIWFAILGGAAVLTKILRDLLLRRKHAARISWPMTEARFQKEDYPALALRFDLLTMYQERNMRVSIPNTATIATKPRRFCAVSKTGRSTSAIILRMPPTTSSTLTAISG